MQAFDIINLSDFADGPRNALRRTMNAAKEGKPYAYIQYYYSETVTYYIPTADESLDHMIALIDTMVVADLRIKNATVLDAQSHIRWSVDRSTCHGYLLEQTMLQSYAGYSCWECGHMQALSFSRCPTCFLHHTCQPSIPRWIATYRQDYPLPQ